MSIRPLDASSISSAIAAYRRVIQLDPGDEIAYQKLAELYLGIKNYEELAYIAKTLLKYSPSDPNAHIWLAQALISSHKNQEAQDTLVNLINKLELLPDKPNEYVQACSLMCQILSDPTSGARANQALYWLTRALDACPESVEVLVTRAQFYRQRSDISKLSEEERLLGKKESYFSEEERFQLAREDLKAAETIGTENLRLKLVIGNEWLELNELDRTDAQLKAIENLSEEIIYKYFFDKRDWTINKFLLASKLAIEKKDTEKCVALADSVLTELKEKNFRVRVLPSVVMLYVAANQKEQARQYLDEYFASRYSQDESENTKLGPIYLQALVARAEEKPYEVINILQPAIVMDESRAELWQLMAEAYIQTDQTRRAISALTRYSLIRPEDKGMMLQLANEYLKLQDWTRALEVVQTAEVLDTTDIQIRLIRIEASIYQLIEQSFTIDPTRFKPLSDELDQMREEHPKRADIRILQAILADNLKDTEKAEKELKDAIKDCQDTLRAEMQLVNHYYRNKRMSEAIEACTRACESHSDLSEPRLTLSSLYVRMNDYKSAENALTDGINSVTNKLELRPLKIQRALLEISYLDREKGIDLLKEIARQDPQEIRARSLLLNIREVLRDRETAQRIINELKEAEGESGLNWRIYQAALWLSGDDWRSKQNDIVTIVQQCIDRDPQWSNPVLLLTTMYNRMGDLTHAEQICREALKRNPSAVDVADTLISQLENQGRFSDAQQILTQVESNSRLNSAWYVRIAYNSGDFARAIQELTLRLSDDRDANSRILLARLLYWQNKDAEQAFELLNQAEAITSNSIALSAAKVAILRAEGRSEEAQEVLDNYVTKSNTFVSYTLRANYLANTGQLEAAEKDFRKLTTFTENGSEGYQLLSNFYVKNQKYDKSLQTLEEALKLYPDDLTLERSRIKVLLIRNKSEDQKRALDMLAGLRKKLPEDPELIKLEAMYILQELTPANIEIAREKFKKVIKYEPTAVDAHLALINIAVQQQRYQDVRNLAITALGSNPNNTEFISARAIAELELGNIQIAQELALQVLQREPTNFDALDVTIKSNNRAFLEKIQTLIESASAINPTDLDMLISLSRIYVALGETQMAITKLQEYTKNNTGDDPITALVTLADLYRINDQMELSQQILEQAEQMNPKSLAVIHSHFLLLIAQKQYDELSQVSSKYFSADKLNSKTLITAGYNLLTLDSAELKNEAVKLFQRAVTIAPISKDAKIGLATSLYQLDQAESAVKIYRELRQLYPDDVQILNNLAWILQEHDKNYETALGLIDRAIEISPENVTLLDTRAEILAKIDSRLEEARDEYEKIIDLSNTNSQMQANALARLGDICVELKDLSNAEKYLQNALEINQTINFFTADQVSKITETIQTIKNRNNM